MDAKEVLERFAERAGITVEQAVERLKEFDNLRKLRLAFLNETVAHYNKLNRSYRNGACYYRPVEGSEGCAIGRHIPDKLLCKQLDEKGGIGGWESETFELLPDNLKMLGRDFLMAIQALHDRSPNWNDDGLTDKGIINVNKIKETFSLIHFLDGE